MADDGQKVPRGKALNWSDEELDRMTSAEAMRNSVPAAREDFKRKTAPKYRKLLEEGNDVEKSKKRNGD